MKTLSSVIRSRPREAALAILIAVMTLTLGGKHLASVIALHAERNECIAEKQSLLDSYERVDELLDNVYRLDSSSRMDIDRIRDLKYSVDGMYKRCKAIVPGWPN